MKCPKCPGEMENVSYDEVKVDRCRACGGLWFDSGELEELRQDTWMADYVIDTGDPRTGKHLNQRDSVACPVCETAMARESDDDQRHIVYERCAQGHGTFLDAGEFTDLVHKTFWDRFKRAT